MVETKNKNKDPLLRYKNRPYLLRQEGASEWRVHSTLIFENLKPEEISTNHFNFT